MPPLIKFFFLAALPFVFAFRKERVKELSALSRKSAGNKQILWTPDKEIASKGKVDVGLRM